MNVRPSSPQSARSLPMSRRNALGLAGLGAGLALTTSACGSGGSGAGGSGGSAGGVLTGADLAEQVRAEYKLALQGGPEADVYQHHMDQELSEIIKGNMELIPLEVRYPELKKQRYDKRR